VGGVGAFILDPTLNTPCISTHFYIITAFYIILFALVFGEIYEQIVFGLENLPEYLFCEYSICGQWTMWIVTILPVYQKIWPEAQQRFGMNKGGV